MIEREPEERGKSVNLFKPDPRPAAKEATMIELLRAAQAFVPGHYGPAICGGAKSSVRREHGIAIPRSAKAGVHGEKGLAVISCAQPGVALNKGFAIQGPAGV